MELVLSNLSANRLDADIGFTESISDVRAHYRTTVTKKTARWLDGWIKFNEAS